MEKWTVGGKPRMALFAGDKGIMTGDELTYDYNFDPFSQKNVQECRCGSSNCRGVLGPKPKDERKAKAEKKKLGTSTTSKFAGAKRKIADILDEGADRWNKRPRIAGPSLAITALKKATTTSSKTKPPARARIYSSTNSSPAKTISRAGLIKKLALGATSPSSRGAIARRPTLLKRIVNSATESRRSALISSSSEALIPGEGDQQLTRTESVKAKAASIRKNVVRTVKRTRGSGRTLRPGHLGGDE